jgi:glycosyltransferase involved in cell wall biosynthesis
MRCLIVSPHCVQPAARGKARALATLGCTVSVAVPARWSPSAHGAVWTAEWGDDAGVRIVPIPVGGTPRGDAARWNRADLRRLLRDFRPNIVQVESEPWTQVAAATGSQAARLGLPVALFSAQSIGRSFSFVEGLRRRKTFRHVRALVGANHLAAGLLARERPDLPVATIPRTGITLPLESPRAERPELSLGFVGRLVPEKGLDILFRACVKLHGRWTLTVVGSGPVQESLEALAERLGIASRVTWCGALPPTELRTLWPTLDCLVVPSRTTPDWVETWHSALIEAMGHGVTVVVSDSGALAELVETAGLVVPEDDVPGLTAAIQRLIDVPHECERLGREARLRVMRQYVDDAIARRTLEFWNRVLEGSVVGHRRASH